MALRLYKMITGILADRHAATSTEYTLVVLLVAVAALVGFQALGDSLTGLYQGLRETVLASMPASSPSP